MESIRPSHRRQPSIQDRGFYPDLDDPSLGSSSLDSRLGSSSEIDNDTYPDLDFSSSSDQSAEMSNSSSSIAQHLLSAIQGSADYNDPQLSLVQGVPLLPEDEPTVQRVMDGITSHTDTLSRENSRVVAELVVRASKLTQPPEGLVRRALPTNPLTFGIGAGRIFLHIKKPVGSGATKDVKKALECNFATLSVHVIAQQKLKLRVPKEKQLQPFLDSGLDRDEAIKQFNNIQREAFIAENSRTAKYRSPYVTAPAIHIQEYTGKNGAEGKIVAYTKLYGKDLSKRLLQSSEPITWNKRLGYAQDVTRGVDAIHEFGDIHGDLKPENILTYGDVALVGDFGTARKIGAEPIANDIRYRAPETIREMRQGSESDIWQLGHILYELFHPENARPPLYRREDQEHLVAVARLNNDEFRDNLFTDWSAKNAKEREMQSLIQDCLNMQPKARPNAKEIKARLSQIQHMGGYSVPHMPLQPSTETRSE